MKKYIQSLKQFRIPSKKGFIVGYRALTRKEKSVVVLSLLVAISAILFILQSINQKFLVTIPKDGGSFTEGIVGMPTLVNPILAISEADKDLTTLVYSGLMRKVRNGVFIPDLAESYTVSPDGTRYTFILKPNLTFHDGSPLSADDVIFTINKIKDPLVKSPRKIEWEGVEVQKVDALTIVFTLKQPYASFMDATTIGILPMNLWKNVTEAEFSLNTLNIKGVGSGPYKITGVTKNSDGVPESYSLTRFTKFALGAPHIKKITITSYANENDVIDALQSGAVDQAGGISPENAIVLQKAHDGKIITSVLPRMFGVFFNSANNSILGNKTVIQAVGNVIDKQEIITSVLKGYGTVINNPVPDTFLEGNTFNTSQKDTGGNKEEAQKILTAAGWKLNANGIMVKGSTTTVVKDKKGKVIKTVSSGPLTPLTFSLTTGDAPELRATAEKIKEELAEIGIMVELKIYETGQLNQIIRARKYEALLFGQVINHESDLFAFWHSSQKKDPGLNVAMYANQKVDALLETAQKTTSDLDRTKMYTQFITLFKNDTPALFIYSPYYIYGIGNHVNIPEQIQITTAKERFLSVYTWYADTDSIYKIFLKK